MSGTFTKSEVQMRLRLWISAVFLFGLTTVSIADPLDRAAETVREPLAESEPGQRIPVANRRPFSLASPTSLLGPTPLTKDESIGLRGFHLTRSRDGADAAEGALFSFLHDSRASDDSDADTYSADFYLVWNPQESAGQRVFDVEAVPNVYSFSVEGHLSTANDNEGDAWRFRASWAPKPLMLNGGASIDWDLALKYEADRDFEAENITLEALATPTAPQLAIGSTLAQSGLLRGFRWRPVLGIELGKVLDEPDDAPSVEEDAVVRLTGSLAAQLRLLSKRPDEAVLSAVKIPLEAVDLFAKDKYQYLPEGDGRETANLFSAGISAVLAENEKSKYSINASYSVGRDAPTFEKVEKIVVGLAVKF